MYGPKEDAAKAKRDAEAALFGLQPDDFGASADDGISGVWPENLTAVRVFDAMSTQWRVGGTAVLGLEYAALPAVMRLLGVARSVQADTFECVRILEDEAMKVMREAARG